MKRLLVGLLSFQLAFITSPDAVIRFDFSLDRAEARGNGRAGGFHGAPKGGGGAKTRPARAGASAPRPRPSVQRPASKPAIKLPNRPSTRPAAKPATRPGIAPGGNLARPANKPRGLKPPGNRPPIAKPPSNRPIASNRPGNRPPVTRPGGNRPPIAARPPGNRPPGARPRPPGNRPPIANRPRPPGWHPPHHHPPGWRPPYVPPPYYRPPHNFWGDYHYNDGWGWFFTAAMVGGTMAFVSSLPDDDCKKVSDSGETLYECDGKLYRSTYYKDEQVYEIVSDPPGETAAPTEPQSVIGLALTSPMTRGEVVRDLQLLLTDYGYDTGGADGIFGSGTETALQWFQYDNGLDTTGVVDATTAAALGYSSPAAPAEVLSATPKAAETAAPIETMQESPAADGEQTSTIPQAEQPSTEEANPLPVPVPPPSE